MSNTMSKKWIIFDAMGVIFVEGDDVKNLLHPFICSLGKELSYESVDEVYGRAMVGEISSEELWSELGLSGKLPICEDDYLGSSFKLDDEFIEVAKSLKGKYNLAMLSNDIGSWSSKLRKIYGLEDIIHTAVISGDIGLKKPNGDIYEKALEIIGAEGKDCIFIDDKMHNLVPAKEIGIRAIKFNREGQPSETPKGYGDMESIRSLKEILDILDN